MTRPTVVTLCGSSRFHDAFVQANYLLTMAGNIVLSVGFAPGPNHGEHVGIATDAEKRACDELHKRKIDISDEVFVLNVGGYIGESTRSEIDYALTIGIPVRYLEDGGEGATYRRRIGYSYARTEPQEKPVALEDAFALSAELLANNAYHAKRGIYLQDQAPEDVLAHMREEISELLDEPDDRFELADILSLAASYAARKGWSPSVLAQAMIQKMQLRFTVPAS